MIKKIGLIFFGILMIIFGTTMSSYASTAKVKSESLRMRKEASTDSEIITDLYQGNELEIIEKSGEWYKVKYNEYTGYVHGDYVVSNEVTTTNPKPEEQTNVPEVNNEKQVNEKIIKNKEDLSVLPLISSEIKCQVNENTTVSVLETLNGWSYIKDNNNYGWIRIDKLSDSEKVIDNATANPETTQEPVKTEETQTMTEETAEQTPSPAPAQEPIVKYVSVESLNLREENNTDSEVVKSLTANTSVKILETLDGWYKVDVDGTIGYINSSYVSDSKVEEVTTSRSLTYPRSSNASAPTAINGEAIAELAKSFVGCAYVYEGTSPETGFDCSGLVWYVYKQFGYTINRTADAQVNNGVEISRENLQPGDILIFLKYSDYSQIGHSGIYIGNDQFVHASTESTGVIITSLSSGAYPVRFVCGRRIVN